MNSDQLIHYQIIPYNPQAHIFRVTCTIPDPAIGGQIFSMAAWIPGSYMIRDFAKNIIELHAESAGRPVVVNKIDKQTWHCEPVNAPLIIQYDVYAWDMSVRSAHLDTTHAYFNGTSVFISLQDREDRKCVVDILPPEGEQYSSWRVATAMQNESAELYGFGRYSASDYDELIDHPVEIGEFSLASFEVANTQHDIVITGRHYADMDRLCGDLKKICQQHINFFGDLPSMQRYVFLVIVTGDGYGGLEHRSSCSLLCSRNDLPKAGVEEVNDNYRSFLGLCSHEYFHTWNIKRIKPERFVPYDLSKEIHTKQLWAFEGITSYYDDLGVARTGLISKDSYLELLSQTITRVLRGSGRFRQSIADSSFDTWTKFYKQDENAPNAIVSYYAKGSLLALALDLTIRAQTENAKSLDDVMVELWCRYGKTGEGVCEDCIEQVAEEISGLSLAGFFKDSLYGTDDLPLADLLEQFGVEYTLRAAKSDKDKGGKPTVESDKDKGDKPRLVLGIRTRDGNASGASVTHVFDQGPAQAAGISAGDVIVAIDGLKLSVSNLEDRLQVHNEGDVVHIHVFRRDELLEFDVELQAAPEDTCVLYIKSDTDEAIAGNLKAWLE